MQLKKLSLFMLILSTSALANNNVTLDKVTLYLQGAELQGQTTVSIAKGENEILLSGVAAGINPSSINIGLGNSSDAIILATTLKDDYLLKNEESSELTVLRQKLKKLEADYQTTNIQYMAVSETVKLLQSNRMDMLVKSNTDMLVDMKNVLDFVKTNLATALTEQYVLQIKLGQIDEQLTKYRSQIEQDESTSHEVSNVIVVKVYADKAVTLPIFVSYVTEQAGWNPVYDVRVTDINSPLKLTYKASVYQSSGLDWNNVDFSLSTSNPSIGITAPVLNPWDIILYDEKSNYSSKYMSRKEVDVVASPLNVSNKAMVNNISINNLGINTQFDVKLPYTIKSNSDNNILMLQDKEVKATYRYVSTPKLDSHVFLQAQIVEWEKLNLLPGQSTVFFNGNYIGESTIDTDGVKDTLDLSLGRDNSILIARNRDLNETSKPSFFGDDVSQKHAYSINIKNTKTLPINLVVYDQLPMIRDKVVSLDNAKYEGAAYNKETGLLTWTLPLKPDETKKLNVSFTLTYPKDKANSIIGL